MNHSPTTTCPQGDLGHEMSSLLSLRRDVLSDVRPAPPRQPPGVARMLPSDTPSCTPLRGICCWVFFKLGGGAGQGQSYQRRMPGRGAGGQEGQHKLSGAGNGKQEAAACPGNQEPVSSLSAQPADAERTARCQHHSSARCRRLSEISEEKTRPPLATSIGKCFSTTNKLTKQAPRLQNAIDEPRASPPYRAC